MKLCMCCGDPIDEARLQEYGEDAVVYCGPACSVAAKQRRKKVRYRESLKEKAAKAREHRIASRLADAPKCLVCDKLIGEDEIRYRLNTKFCSEACKSAAAATKRRQAYGMSASDRKSKLEEEWKTNPRRCLNCEIPLNIDKFLTRTRPPIYCSKRCRESHATRFSRYRSIRPGVLLSPGGQELAASTVGEVVKLRIVCDLLEKGYQVFAEVIKSSCDLIAMDKSGVLKRVECRAGHMGVNGLVRFQTNGSDRGKTDIYAVATPEGIIQYFDEIPKDDNTSNSI
jgi:predicted nucleic acid-binding Zn ribbon protein